MSGIKAFACFLLVFLFFGAAAHAEKKRDLCQVDEVMIASCSLNEEKNRLLSFCADSRRETVIYRFGTDSKIELINVFSTVKPMFRWLDLATNTTYFGFRISEYSYVLGVPEEAFGAKAFLEVSRRNKSLKDFECIENSFGEKTLKNGAIREVSDKWVRGNKFLFPPDKGGKLLGDF